jgi:hypothetical protein
MGARVQSLGGGRRGEGGGGLRGEEGVGGGARGTMCENETFC